MRSIGVTPDDTQLEDLFEELAENISKPGATNIEITDTLNSCFKINNIVDVSKGVANILNDTAIKWEMDQLGTNSSEGATLEFSVSHIGACTGMVKVNDNIDYSDNEGNVVLFADPSINVECNEPICVEECPTPVDVTIDGCDDTVEYDAGDIYLDSLGRILELEANIKNVCPNRRVALAVIVTEVDDNGIEYKRGIKMMVIPAHTHSTCRDIKVKCIRFVLPESLDVSNTNGSICNSRKFKVRFISHYIDNDFGCCNDLT